uniref:Uncharacterized protein n=1 Tax=Anguilla anguilla TaxID=7936 RepID=A0A0E9PTV1_ANGAN
MEVARTPELCVIPANSHGHVTSLFVP